MDNQILEAREIIMAGDTAYCLIRDYDKKTAHLILCDENAGLEEMLSLEEGMTPEALAGCQIQWWTA